MTPDIQNIREVLNEYAEPTKDGKWRLKPDFKRREREHDAIAEVLCELGEKAGFEVYADTPKRRKPLSFPIPKQNLDRVQEIDVLWYKDDKVVYEFEVENTTSITEAIVRGSNIPYRVKRFIVIPDERENLLAKKVEEPALKERIINDGWGFIRYDDLILFYNKNKSKKVIMSAEVEGLSKMPKAKLVKTSTIDEFVG